MWYFALFIFVRYTTTPCMTLHMTYIKMRIDVADKYHWFTHKMYQYAFAKHNQCFSNIYYGGDCNLFKPLKRSPISFVVPTAILVHTSLFKYTRYEFPKRHGVPMIWRESVYQTKLYRANESGVGQDEIHYVIGKSLLEAWMNCLLAVVWFKF